MADKDKGTDVVPVTQAADMIMGAAPIDVVDSEDVIREIVSRILTADDLDGIFAEDSSIATKDIVNVPIRVTDCVIRESQLEDSRGSYMLIMAINLETGEQILVNTGSPKIMAQLYQAKRIGKLPIEVVVKEIGTAQKGQNAPLTLRPTGRTQSEMAHV